MHIVPPEVDFEPSRSPAKSESWNSPSLHFLAVLPTWQYCLYSHVIMNIWNQSIQASVTGYGPFWWWIVQICLLTIEHQVFQYVPSTNISEQFEMILSTILPRISMLLLWNVGRQCKELILCRVVESFCSPTHNIVPHISWHDLLWEDHEEIRRFWRHGSFSVPPAEIRDSNMVL